MFEPWKSLLSDPDEEGGHTSRGKPLPDPLKEKDCTLEVALLADDDADGGAEVFVEEGDCKSRGMLLSNLVDEEGYTSEGTLLADATGEGRLLLGNTCEEEGILGGGGI